MHCVLHVLYTRYFVFGKKSPPPKRLHMLEGKQAVDYVPENTCWKVSKCGQAGLTRSVRLKNVYIYSRQSYKFKHIAAIIQGRLFAFIVDLGLAWDLFSCNM